MRIAGAGIRIRCNGRGEGYPYVPLDRDQEGLLGIAACVGPFEERTGDGPLEEIISRLRIHSLRSQVAASREYCNVLATKFESAATNSEKVKIARRYDEALKQTHAMQLLLELLERETRGAAGMQGETASSC
jgi:hypothetical protein